LTLTPASKDPDRASWKLRQHFINGKGMVWSGNCPHCGKQFIEWPQYSMWVHYMGGCHPDSIVAYTPEGMPVYSNYD
jgi:hypothetical protein